MHVETSYVCVCVCAWFICLWFYLHFIRLPLVQSIYALLSSHMTNKDDDDDDIVIMLNVNLNEFL